eukprot:TRINITY_DN33045_c0_g1_i4.p2 TRINITY_DN33045_c0_g1~~TRINITY_DN33045_c0_g1_i4.p2  ORF type:complete len:113 (-),score=1.72 TRINITY_DN33045_c0_g1_i4:149-487(-)
MLKNAIEMFLRLQKLFSQSFKFNILQQLQKKLKNLTGGVIDDWPGIGRSPESMKDVMRKFRQEKNWNKCLKRVMNNDLHQSLAIIKLIVRKTITSSEKYIFLQKSIFPSTLE